MNNGLQIFENTEFENVKVVEKSTKNEYMGYFYLMEWGNLLKIGCSKKPHQRLMSLKRTAEKYSGVKIGRFALSQEHTNYMKNEKLLHTYFKEYRKPDTELFDISFDEAIKNFPKDIVYEDDSERQAAQANWFIGGVKNFILTGDFKNE